MTIKRKDEIYIYYLHHLEKESNESDLTFVKNLNEEEKKYLIKLRVEYNQLQKRLKIHKELLDNE